MVRGKGLGGGEKGTGDIRQSPSSTTSAASPASTRQEALETDARVGPAQHPGIIRERVARRREARCCARITEIFEDARPSSRCCVDSSRQLCCNKENVTLRRGKKERERDRRNRYIQFKENRITV